MVCMKSRAANDTTVGDAERVTALARRLKDSAGGNPIAIHALLIGTPRRDQDHLMRAWGVYSLHALSEAIATMGESHGL